jgi:hypothetical protein
MMRGAGSVAPAPPSTAHWTWSLGQLVYRSSSAPLSSGSETWYRGRVIVVFASVEGAFAPARGLWSVRPEQHGPFLSQCDDRVVSDGDVAVPAPSR